MVIAKKRRIFFHTAGHLSLTAKYRKCPALFLFCLFPARSAAAKVQKCSWFIAPPPPKKNPAKVSSLRIFLGGPEIAILQIVLSARTLAVEFSQCLKKKKRLPIFNQLVEQFSETDSSIKIRNMSHFKK